MKVRLIVLISYQLNLTSSLALHKRKDLEPYQTLREKLVLGDYNPDKILNEYDALLRETFSHLKRLPYFNIDALLQNSKYIHWRTCPHSCILLLQGNTVCSQRDLSWLSPATVGLVNILRREGCIVAFHCCQVNDFMHKDIPAYIILSAIICQLLEAQPSILRDQILYADLKSKIDNPGWRHNSLNFQVCRSYSIDL